MHYGNDFHSEMFPSSHVHALLPLYIAAQHLLVENDGDNKELTTYFRSFS